MKDLRAQNIVEVPDIDGRYAHTATGRWQFIGKGLALDSVSTRVAYDSAPVAIALCDLAGRLMHANHALQELLNTDSLEALIGKDLVTSCTPVLSLDFLDQLAIDGRPRQQLFTSTMRNGESRQILCNARRIEGEEHLPRWLVITLTELGSQHSSANAVPSDVDLTSVERLAGLAYWQVTLDGQQRLEELPMHWSAGMSALVNGQRADKVICLHDWLSLVTTTDRMRMQMSLLHLASTGHSHDIEYELEHRSGNVRRLRSRAWRQAHPTLAGHFLLVGVEQDITSENSPELQLQAAIQTFKTLFDTNDFLACVVDHRLHLRYGNPAFQTVLNHHLGHAAGSAIKLRELFATTKLRRSVIDNMRCALTGEHRIQAVELVDATGVNHSYDLSFNPIVAEDGHALGVSMCGHKLPSRSVTATRSMPLSALHHVQAARD